MRKAIIAVIIIFILLVIGLIFYKNKKEQVTYNTEPIIRGNISEFITASGTINPIKKIVIGSQVSGPIKEIYVDYNTIVKKGQLLAQIDPALFEAKVYEARANLKSAEAYYQKQEAILKNNERIMNRNKDLYETDLIARIEFENAETEYLATQAELFSAKGKIEQAKALLNNALTNLKYTRIVSPCSGIVISRDVEVGQTVAASFQTPTLFNVAEDLTKMQIETNVSEADISMIHEDQPVEYTVDSYPGEIFQGKVVQIRNSPEIIQNVVTYYVIIEIDNEDLKLKPGMTANVSILTKKAVNALLAPNDSLRFTPYDKETTKKYEEQGVWVLKNDKPARISIKTGISNDKYTEIFSDKIKEGQKVIISKANGKKKKDRPSRPMRMP